ncbi:MAG: hypothetical protein K9H16_04175 [Bacteroidales bacterium]|nr:hypothetical protein [Bacteroidales bacterium]
MKTTFKFLLTFLIFVAFTISGIKAQTFEDYKKKRQQELQQFKDERAKQLQQLTDEFDKYVEKQDQEFADYLKKRWQEYQVFQGITPPEEPKPDVPPVFEVPETPPPPQPIPVIKPSADLPSGFIPQPILPRITRPEPDDFPAIDKSFDFYGFPISYDFDENMAGIQLSGIPDEAGISEVFSKLSQTNYNLLLEQFYEYSDMLNLNDWGYYRLLKSASESLNTSDENTQKVLTWFMLIRSGYKAKIAYFDNSIYILLPIRNQVYDVKFFNLEGQTYYIMDGEPTNIYTYDNDFPEAQKVFDLNLIKALSFGSELAVKTVSFSYGSRDFQLPFQYNKNLIGFYQDYPLSDMKIYFDAVVSPELKSSISTSFAPLIGEMTELEAVNLLLHFVQTGFAYETDQEQFGFEKFFFAEEAFHYPFCDCEDRSVLFAYLVQHLLGLEVIGLNYPGHAATAVCFNEDVTGDFFEFEGKKYIVSDPTYINAPVGLTMPEYVNQQAEIIIIDNKYFVGREKDELWDEIIAVGGNRGDNGHDMIIEDDGSKLLTGYFTRSFKFANIDIAGGKQPAMFAIKVDADNQPLWFSNSQSNGISLAYNLTQDKNQDYYVTGTFEGELTIDSKSVVNKSDSPDIFLAKYSRAGKLLWLEKANLDTANHAFEKGNNYLNFVARFSNNGRHLDNKLYFETGDFNNYGISVDPSGEIIVAGAFNKTTGMNLKSVSFNSSGEFDAIEALKAENDKLIAQHYEKTIAGLFAVVNLVQSSGMSIPGSAASEVLDRYNPDFKAEYPEIYGTISKIHFIKNQDGIVTVKTDNEKELSIDMMRVSNDAKLKISILENGDAKISVLSGIRVGKAFWWYQLNHILLYKNNGNLLFDYDVDHEMAMKNLKIDILY